MGSLRNIKSQGVADERQDLLLKIMQDFENEVSSAENLDILRSVRFNFNFSLESGKSPLTLSLEMLPDEAVEIFLSRGADPNYVPVDGNSPLNIACVVNRRWDTLSTVELLLNYGASPNAKSGNGIRVFDNILGNYSADDFSLVMLLISRGASIPKKNMDVLERIVKTGNLPLLKLFVSGGNYEKSDFLEHGHKLGLAVMAEVGRNLDTLRFLIECGVDGTRVLDVLENDGGNDKLLLAHTENALWESLPNEMTQEIRKVLRGER
jgi:hypothetical protein